MWIVAIALTVFFWLVLDNILVGAMLAIFAIFLFSISRALLKLREQQKMEKASLAEQGADEMAKQIGEESTSNDSSQVESAQAGQLKNEQIDEVDYSYVTLVEPSSATQKNAGNKHTTH